MLRRSRSLFSLTAGLAISAGACSFCDLPLPCAADENCPRPLVCRAEVCVAFAPGNDGGDDPDDDAGGADDDAGEPIDDAGDADDDAGERLDAGDPIEDGGAPADAGVDCTTLTACARAFCEDPGAGAVRAIDFGAGAKPTFCLAHDGDVWTLIAKVDADDSGLTFVGDQGGFGAATRNADNPAHLDFGPGENTLFDGYATLQVHELLIGFVPLSTPSDSVGFVAPPVRAPVPAAFSGDVRALLDSGARIEVDAAVVSAWVLALGALESGEVLPGFATAGGGACLAFGRDVAPMRLRLGLVDDCDDPTAYLGLGARGCDPTPLLPTLSTDEPAAGACAAVGGADNDDIVVRSAVLFAR